MTIEEKANRVVEKARELAAKASSWTAFSNAAFAPNGLVAQSFPKMTERRAFYQTPQYEEVNRIFLDIIKRFGISQSAAPRKSGKFVVRVPKTLHAALEVEANDEGVSLNQLALTKLTVPLSEATDLLTSRIVQAFRAVHNGYSTERVVIDDELNARYLKECRRLGILSQSDYDLNHALYDTRKSGKANLPPTTKRPVIRDYDQFEFASEIAFRFLQRTEGVSLDRVLCDPPLRSRFDEIAHRLALDVSVLKLRAGALNLRKSRRMRPTDAATPLYQLSSAGPITHVDLSKLPTDPAAYVFYEDGRPVFAGETANLRDRMERHAKASGNRGIPTWIEDVAASDLILRYAALPEVNQATRLNWLRNFINREKPVLNYQKAA
jgi:hypothetical protein